MWLSLHRDASAWAQAAAAKGDAFDAVLVDSTDFGSSDPLHTGEFYGVLRRLARGGDGVVVINLTSLSWNLGGYGAMTPAFFLSPSVHLCCQLWLWFSSRTFRIHSGRARLWLSDMLCGCRARQTVLLHAGIFKHVAAYQYPPYPTPYPLLSSPIEPDSS